MGGTIFDQQASETLHHSEHPEVLLLQID